MLAGFCPQRGRRLSMGSMLGASRIRSIILVRRSFDSHVSLAELERFTRPVHSHEPNGHEIEFYDALGNASTSSKIRLNPIVSGLACSRHHLSSTLCALAVSTMEMTTLPGASACDILTANPLQRTLARAVFGGGMIEQLSFY